jgi:hypothetical protein
MEVMGSGGMGVMRLRCEARANKITSILTI